MSNVLVIDDQKWVVDLCKDELAGEMCKVSATDNVESVRENIFSFKPDVVLLNLYLNLQNVSKILLVNTVTTSKTQLFLKLVKLKN